MPRAGARVLSASLVVGVALATAACGDDGGQQTESTSTSSLSATSVEATTSTPSPPTTAATGSVSIEATVASVSASAHVLHLRPAVEGFESVAVTQETVFERADGSAAALLEVEAGSTVRVTGEPGAPGVVIADRVVVLG